ncbi:MAG: hypothetical protein FWF77_00310 [Defluviitaleaceae bacterium]|nr:hypothetical protein [Defluviitaleaceae bacterium]
MSNMVVRTNTFAINSHRNLKNVGLAQRKSAQRLSSGFRVNSAADDAAGLAISETMRAQIRGLDQASVNTQDAVGLIQTAEGAMATVSDMIIRMRELMVQAANDTYTLSNRDMIQIEIDQLMTEINDVTFRTQFNTRTLLAGGLTGEGGGQTFPVSLQWMIFDQMRVIGLPHPGGTVGPTGLHPNPNNRNHTSLRHEIIELQTELTSLARRVADRLVGEGVISRDERLDMFDGFPHDFTTLIPHMQQSEMQQMRSIENRLENRLRAALRSAEEIYQTTQNQVNALGGIGAINSDGSRVFSQRALEEWSEDARTRLNEIRDSISGPSTLSRYPQGYLNRLAEIDDIASLYDIIGYLVGWPGPIPDVNFVPPEYVEDPDWEPPMIYGEHDDPNWIRPSISIAVDDPAYDWIYWDDANTFGNWVNRSSGEVWQSCAAFFPFGPTVLQSVPNMNVNPPRITGYHPDPNVPPPMVLQHQTYRPCPFWVRPLRPSIVTNPDWLAFEQANRVPQVVPERIENPVNPAYGWNDDVGEWQNVANGQTWVPEDGIGDPSDPTGGPRIQITIPPRTIWVRNDEPNPYDSERWIDGPLVPDWLVPHPLVPNTQHLEPGHPLREGYYGRTLNNLERLLGLGLDALGTVNLESNALWFQIGANSLQGTVLQLKGIHTGILGGGRGDLTTLIDVRERNGIPISEQLDIIDLAEGIVNAQRAQLGAVQNRLEFTRQSLDISSENLSAAESRIRDTDMALEMMRFTAAQVLQQAGISMLAQANQLPSSLLQLLQ